MIAVTGVNGLLGSALVRRLRASGRAFTGLGRGAAKNFYLAEYPFIAAELAEPHGLRAALDLADARVVIHAGAMTAVDRAETERALAWRTNVDATALIAQWCAQKGRRLIYVSTDYVFDGQSGPYKENAAPRPLGVYAATKTAGELAVQTLAPGAVIARTSVPFGDIPHVKKDFVRWLVEELRADRPVRIVTDQLSSPTFVGDLAVMLEALAISDFAGIVHTAGDTGLSRYDFARMVARVFGLDAGLISPIMTADLAQAARRPLDARLDVSLARSLGLPPARLEPALVELVARG